MDKNLRRLPLFLIGCLSLCCDNAVLDRQASDNGQRYWESILTKCGDSSFGVQPTSGKVVEFRSAFGLASRDARMDDSPYINGLEWIGQCRLSCSTFRIYKDAKWSAWHNLIDMDYELGNTYLPMQKINGQWVINNGKPGPFKPIPCEQLPPL
jgi:hypothetical protein